MWMWCGDDVDVMWRWSGDNVLFRYLIFSLFLFCITSLSSLMATLPDSPSDHNSDQQEEDGEEEKMESGGEKSERLLEEEAVVPEGYEPFVHPSNATFLQYKHLMKNSIQLVLIKTPAIVSSLLLVLI